MESKWQTKKFNLNVFLYRSVNNCTIINLAITLQKNSGGLKKMDSKYLKNVDPEIFRLVEEEEERQEYNI